MPHTPLPPRRTGHPPSEALIAERAAILANLRSCPFDSRCRLGEHVIGGVPCAVIMPSAPRARLIHFHGGGYRYSAPQRVSGFLSSLAADGEIEMIVPAYSLAPEAPFPNALHEGRAVIDAVSAEDDDSPLLIGGDSAGGGLALALTASRDPSQALAGLFLISPWLDLTFSADSYARNRDRDPIFSETISAGCAADYLQGADSKDPFASPLFASFENLPTTLIVAGAGERLVDDSIALARALGEQQIRVTLELVPGMEHVAPLLDPNLPGAGEARRAVRRFLFDRAPD
jgi:monoterpene epsilon-lactone hydrolase